MNSAEIKPYIRLSTKIPLLRRQEWRPWKKLGYRILDKDGVTVYHEQEAIKNRILQTFANVDADVFLFGSRAQGTMRERSDYDVGYYTQEKVPARLLTDLKADLEEMPIPAAVDIVDFAQLDKEFVRIALQGGVNIWKQKQTNSLFTSEN